MAISDEMLDAGASVIYAELGTIDMGPLFDARKMAEEVYRKMNTIAARDHAANKGPDPAPKRMVALTLQIVGDFKSSIETIPVEESGP